MAAWASAGVGLPHAASQQYAMTARVDSGSLIPGDLVFFYSDLHHVGIYVGGGTFVHAANPGDGVVAEAALLELLAVGLHGRRPTLSRQGGL